MKKIICLMEGIDNESEKYINMLDSDETEIHIYDFVIESCEKKMFYLLGELFSIFCENDSKCTIVTNVEDIYEVISEICYSLFENVTYIEQSVSEKFEENVNYIELLKYESKIFEKGEEEKNINLILQSLNMLDTEKYSELCNLIQADSILKKEKKIWFYTHLCRVLFFANKSGQIQMNVSIMLYLKSMLMQLEKNVENTNEFLGCFIYYFIENEDYCYFAWNQMKRAGLESRIESDKRTAELMDYIYNRCFGKCSVKIKDSINVIPYSQRNKDVVVVLSIQYLSNMHAPTKTIIERCKTLKRMGKKVYFINTTEQYEIYKYVPFFGMKAGKGIDDYYRITHMEMNGEDIPFCQINKEQGIVQKYYQIISLINNIKPEYVLSIGTGSMLADLCAYSIPCAEMALTFSKLPHTENCIPILGRKMDDEEKKALDRDIIESRFTFELKEQKNRFSRQQFGIPKDRFVLVIVGIRLDYEITGKFLEMLDETCKNDMYVVIAGVYDNYNQVVQKYNGLRQNSKFIGYCDDILALMEICDLYVNPDRVGGGFSIIEAFYQGTPGVYLKRGDVYTSGGDEFSVDTIDEMYSTIMKYKDDKEFYSMRSRDAKERATYMTDSMDAMKKLDEVLCQWAKNK